MDKLVHTVKELDENRASLVIPVPDVKESKASLELMTEWEPVLLNKNLEPFNRPIERIQHYLSQWAKLSGPIPSVSAVNEDIDPFYCDSLKDVVDCEQDPRDQLEPVSCLKLR